MPLRPIPAAPTARPARATAASAARRTGATGATGARGVDQMDRSRAPQPAMPTGAVGAVARTQGVRLAEGVVFARGAFDVDGIRVALTPGLSTGRAGLLLDVARRVAGTGTFGALSQAARRDLTDALVPILQTRTRGRASLVQTRLHAAAFALLEELAASMRAPSEKSTVRRIHAALVQAAAHEGHAPLEVFMRDRLDGARADEPVFAPAPPFPDRRSISFRPDARALVDDVARQAQRRAVARLGALWSAWAEPFGNDAARALVVKADGFTEGTTSTGTSAHAASVRLQKRGTTFEVALDRTFAGADPDVIGMLTVFDGAQALLQRVHPDATEHQRRMIALGMVARLVYEDLPHGDVADLLLARFARARGFPPTLSFAAVEKAMRVEGSAQVSPKTLATLERAMEYTFLEVNPRRTSTAFRMLIGRALEILLRSPAPVGRRTYEAIATGKIVVDDLADLNAEDYQRLRRDFRKDGILVDERRDGVIKGASLRAITATIDGYMWDERIYVSGTLDPRDAARILVHEVNHVLNASEEHYRSDQKILVEEYRAFYAQSLLDGPMKPAACRALKERVIRDYGLTGVTPDDVPDVPPGII